MKKDIKITFRHPSDFKIDDKVYWVRGPESVTEGKITAFGATIVRSRNTLIAIPQTARLSVLAYSDYFEVDWDAVPLQYLTKDKAKALAWFLFFPVKCDGDDWIKAIGKRPTFEEIEKAAREKTYDSEDSLDTCELQRCCANISDVRDALIRCMDKGGLIGWERENLQWLVNNSCHDKPKDTPILNSILEQLGVKWKEEK